MRIIAFMEEEAVIRKILSHLNLWLPQYHDPPDIPDNYNISAALTADSFSPIVNMDLESTQLNLFSDISCEYCEEYKHTGEDCHPPFEEEFSQEVFYED